MIVSIRHKGVRDLFEKGQSRGVVPRHVRKLRLQLIALETAQEINDVDVPGWKLHSLRGRSSSRWSIAVDKNWRLTFEFHAGNVYLLDYEDYH